MELDTELWGNKEGVRTCKGTLANWRHVSGRKEEPFLDMFKQMLTTSF